MCHELCDAGRRVTNELTLPGRRRDERYRTASAVRRARLIFGAEAADTSYIALSSVSTVGIVEIVAKHLERIRSGFRIPDMDLFRALMKDVSLLRVILNSTSWVEANLAIQLLSKTIPEKTLVAAANLRETIKDLPRHPISMAVDFEMLSRVWELESAGGSFRRKIEEAAGDYEVILLGDGNLCYDIAVKTEERTLMWMPNQPEADFLNPDVVDLLLERGTLLPSIVDLVTAMGLPVNPIFYLSLEDWHQEYAQAIFTEIEELFRTQEEKPSRFESARTADNDIRYRGVSQDADIAWLL